MRATLPFREALQSSAALVIMVAMVSAPLLVGFTTGSLPTGVLPSGSFVTRHVRINITGVPVISANAGNAPACIKLNATAVRLGLSSYYSWVCGVEFILAGVMSSFVLGQALEYKYFFLEVLLTKSRLKAFVSRYSASLLGVVFASLLASITASTVPYLLSAYASLTECFLVCLGLLILASLSGASFGALASLGLRSVSGGVVATLGFTGFIAVLSASGSTLGDVVVPLFVVQHDLQGLAVYLSVLALLNLLSLWRVIRVEY